MSRYSKYGRTGKEAAHNKLFLGLCDIAEKSKILDVPHIVYMGINFFVGMALDSAPNKEEALKLVNDTIKNTIEDRESDNA